MSNRTPITEHEGAKYLRPIVPAAIGLTGMGDGPIAVDVYAVLNAFNVTCPATAHAIKKLLCAGERGKGDRKADLIGTIAAINRAIDFAEREEKPHSGAPTDSKAPQEYTFTKSVGRWEVFEAKDTEKIIGYQVRWSQPDEDGKYLWVEHYLTDGREGDPSLGWCKNAAERGAERRNKSGDRPERS